LSGFFFFLTLYCYLRAVSIAQVHPHRSWFWGAVLFYSLSLLSKATAMTLPAVLVFLDIYPLRRLEGAPGEWFKPEVRIVWWEKLPFLTLASVFAALALFSQHSTGALKPVLQYDFLSRLGQAFYGIVFYIWKTLLPINLSPLYELPYDPGPWLPVYALCAVGTAAISVALYLLRSRWPALLACWAFYVVTVAPVLGFAQSGNQLVADRYSYLPCLSWALLAAGLFFPLQKKTMAISAVPVGVVCVLGYLTWAQIGVWHDSRTLWQYVTAIAPDSSIGQYNLGKTFETEGRLTEAMQLYSRAVTLNPTNGPAQYNFAHLLAQSGRPEEAIRHYRQALETNPDDADTHNNLGLLLALRGQTKASLAELRKALEIDPNHARAYFNIGRILAQEGALDEAVVNFQRALKISPNEWEIHLGLGNVLARQGQMQAATAHFTTAVELNPGSADAHVALARSLAAQGKTADASNHYQQALQLLKSQHPPAPEGP
jgi:tetratricopeptide (TPR) repeat protein